ncbi:dihydroneopterin aldolase [Aquilutibacter rugosus]|jgi:dihydroneopterin aldolase|uniref:dihydroneopterin aldolase n=1 Tax=Aquilutibacter rugosus TaxID=3115820 RepID=UPI002F3FAB19
MSNSTAWQLTGAAIVLDQYIVMANIGIYPRELEAPQRLALDVRLELGNHWSAQNDDISTVVDYDFIRQEIDALVASRHFNLQETLVEAIVGVCMDQPAVTACTVRSSKLDIYENCRAVGIEVSACRSESKA